jgi:hypothetical protein
MCTTDLEAACSPTAILATNTSTIDIELVGAKLKVCRDVLMRGGDLRSKHVRSACLPACLLMLSLSHAAVVLARYGVHMIAGRITQ